MRTQGEACEGFESVVVGGAWPVGSVERAISGSQAGNRTGPCRRAGGILTILPSNIKRILTCHSGSIERCF